MRIPFSHFQCSTLWALCQRDTGLDLFRAACQKWEETGGATLSPYSLMNDIVDRKSAESKGRHSSTKKSSSMERQREQVHNHNKQPAILHLCPFAADAAAGAQCPVTNSARITSHLSCSVCETSQIKNKESKARQVVSLPCKQHGRLARHLRRRDVTPFLVYVKG